MADERQTVTYRELAERLGIPVDAARARARRNAKSGRWRLIPGNHPLDRVQVDLPAQDLVPEPKRAPARKRTRRASAGSAASRAAAEALGEQLAEQNRRLERADMLLAQAKDVLIQVQAKLLGKEIEIGRLRAALAAEQRQATQRVLEAKDEVIRIGEAQRRDAAELAAAEMRELGTKAELERALLDVEALRAALLRERLPWWRRLAGGAAKPAR